MGERYLFFCRRRDLTSLLLQLGSISIYYLMKIISEMRGSKGSPKA